MELSYTVASTTTLENYLAMCTTAKHATSWVQAFPREIKVYAYQKCVCACVCAFIAALFTGAKPVNNHRNTGP